MVDFGAVAVAGHSVFGQDATHIDAVTSVETAIKIVRKVPEQIFSVNGESRVIGTVLVNVLVSEVAVVSRDDSIVIGGTTYTVIGEPEKDSQGLIWMTHLVEA